MAGLANAYSIHSVVPLAGHQSKYDAASPDEDGSSPSLTPRGSFRPDVVTPCLPRDVVLAGAPAAEDDRFRVPRILGEEA